MTSTRLPSVAAGVGGDRLHALCDELSRRGRPVRISRSHLWGESDVRLVVAPSSALVVELLGPCDHLVGGDRWQAVRITPGSRVVWSGPPRHSGVVEVSDFVDDLLRRDVDDLVGRYDRLG